MIVGVDFGTCFSSVAVMDGKIAKDNMTGDLEQVLGNTALGIPSLFMYSKEQKKEVYGAGCLAANPHENSDVIKYMKREVRKDPQNIGLKYPTGGKEYLLEDIIGKYVMYLVKSVKDEISNSGDVDSTDIEVLTITKPVGIAEGQMMAADYSRLLKDKMIEITGLNPKKIHLLDEPVAAAIAYLYEQDLRRKIDGIKHILVFDLGGGTLDTTIVRYNPLARTYEIIVKNGDLELGGKDWDDALGKILLEKNGISLDDLSEDEKGNFWNAVTELKIGLSTKEEDVQQFKYGGNKIYLECSAQEFESACTDLLERSRKVLTGTIDQLKDGVESLDGIILVGGSSNMPMILNMITSQYPDFDKEKISTYRPSKAIARGAAIYSYFHTDDGGMVGGGGEVIDSSNCSYGFSCLRGMKEKMIYNGIIKGEKYKDGFIETLSSRFTAVNNDQKAVRFDIYESTWILPNAVNDADPSEGYAPEDDEFRWMPLNSGESKNGMSVTVQVPPEYDGRARSWGVYARFRLSSDGILDLTIEDEQGNKVGFATNKGVRNGQ